MLLALLALLVVALISLLLIFRPAAVLESHSAELRAIGSSLLTGAIVGFGVLLIEIQLDTRQEERAREQQFRLTLAASQNLHGLDPELPLAGLHLSGKNLDEANLAGEDLRETVLQGASLRGADLTDADLRGADLFDANLAEATLPDADLRGADLRYAKLTGQIVPEGGAAPTIQLDGATQVNGETCWPEAFLTSQLAEPLRAALGEGEPTEEHGKERQGPSIGHACEFHRTNLLESFDQEIGAPRTLGDAAEPRNLEPAKLIDLLDKGGRTNSTVTRLPVRPCTGATHVVARDQDWKQGSAFLLVTPPRQSPAATRILSAEIRQRLDEPLEAGSDVLLVGADTDDYSLEHSRELKIQRCR